MMCATAPTVCAATQVGRGRQPIQGADAVRRAAYAVQRDTGTVPQSSSIVQSGAFAVQGNTLYNNKTIKRERNEHICFLFRSNWAPYRDVPVGRACISGMCPWARCAGRQTTGRAAHARCALALFQPAPAGLGNVFGRVGAPSYG